MSKKKIFVAGHKGMVGSSFVRLLKKKNVCLITKDHNELDLTKQSLVEKFFKEKKIDQIYLAAAKVGGIYANNTYPAEFIYKNIMIQTNIIHSAFLSGIKKLLFLGSSCIYPRSTKQPMKEEFLLTGTLEPTNEPYSIAKISGIKLCESYNRQYKDTHNIDYRCVIPTNLYGPNDNYHPKNSHVIPALIKKFHTAKIKNERIVEIWGTGRAKREFLHVDDLARACFKIMNLSEKKYTAVINPSLGHINVGYGKDITILELAKIIKKIVNFKGKIEFNFDKPDGMMKKLLDSKHIHDLKWKPKISLYKGLVNTYKNFKETL
jgi:GDP-L-fucose synthase